MPRSYHVIERRAPARLRIVDTTLREGEQHAGVTVSADGKLDIALALEAFGIQYIEVTSPVVSEGAFRECRMLAESLSRSRLLAHVRCTKADIERAIDAGVDGLNLFVATSERLRRASGLGSLMDAANRALDALSYARLKAPGIELRLSCEDAFRTAVPDVLTFVRYVCADAVADRIGLADTVGAAHPLEVYELVRSVRELTGLEVEFHGHDDTGCAIANCLMALEAGATFIDTSVLGLGERNGITPLAGLLARLQSSYPHLLCDYDLEGINILHEVVAGRLRVPIPACHYLVGSTAFNHKAGVHLNAIRNDLSAYEAFEPEIFGMTRRLEACNRLSGKSKGCL